MSNLEELDKKIQEFKNNSSFFKNRNKNKDQPDNLKNLLIEFIGILIVAMFLGYFLDHLMHTKPIFFLISIIFGLISGLTKIYRHSTK